MEKKKKPICKTSTVDLVKEVSEIENEINMKIMKYNDAIALEDEIVNGIARYNVIIKELVRRFPFLAEDPEFQVIDVKEHKKEKEYKLL